MKKSLAITLIFSMLLLAGCSSSGKNVTQSQGYYRYHVVEKGDTLYSIAWDAGHDYRKVARWNGIRWPYRIKPGQRIYLTPGYYYDKHRYKSKKTKSSKTKKYTHKKSTKKTYKQAISGTVRWHWPVKGKILSYFSASQPGKNGVDISGRNGTPIKAAASGRVVYSGSGLRGYGNLVIIKHNETYFSAYAHNRKIYVKENQKVKSGQKIADMGSTGTNKVMLHFEIRRNGKPVNPLRYLPKS